MTNKNALTAKDSAVKRQESLNRSKRSLHAHDLETMNLLVQRVTNSPQILSQAEVLRLQNKLGNQGVQQLMRLKLDNTFSKSSSNRLARSEGVHVEQSSIPDKDIQYEFFAHTLGYENIIKKERYLSSNSKKGTVFDEWGYQHPWKRTVYNTKTGLFIGLILPKTGGNKLPVMVFRGTGTDKGGFDIRDLAFADTDIDGVGWSQFESNKSDIASLIVFAGGKVDAVGHSLGGALAQYAALEFPQGISNVVTFQSPGISAEKVKNFKKSKSQTKVTHHITNNDFVDLAGEEYLPGEVYEHTSSKFASHAEIGIHMGPHTRKLFNRPSFRRRLDKLGLSQISDYSVAKQAITEGATKKHLKHPNNIKVLILSTLRNMVAKKTPEIKDNQSLKQEVTSFLDYIRRVL